MKILAATATGLLLLGLAACRESSTSSDSAICDAGPCEILGTFALQSIDGEALPAVVSALTDPIFVEVTEGSVTFNDDTTCIVSSTRSETMTDGTATIGTDIEQCVYAFDLNNQTFTMTFPPDSTVNGSIIGSTITLTDDGSVFVYMNI